jgi:hypothetical protein
MLNMSILPITFSLFIIFGLNASAAIELPVVSDYNLAEAPGIWRMTRSDQLPKALLSLRPAEGPSAPYSIFPRSFFQTEKFTVCYQNCHRPELFEVDARLSNGLIYSKNSDWDVIEQANVYFWLTKYFNFLEERFSYHPEQHLVVYTKRDINDESGSKKNNNAFYNASDFSLSFLPAKNNLRLKLRHGKINRSGFDPSVIIHEASHYFFNQLFAHPINEEIKGLDEGLADYMANIVLENPKVGLIMLQGKAHRDSSSFLDQNQKIKVYSAQMEIREIGEAISLALWKTREITEDKLAFDRTVVDAIKELASNPYSTIHDFKNIMLRRIGLIFAKSNQQLAHNIWEAIFPGQTIRVNNLRFLSTSVAAKNYVGFKLTRNLPEQYATAMGERASKIHHFTILKMESISPFQKAILIANEASNTVDLYWVVIDLERYNVLGIYDLNGKLVIEDIEITPLQKLIHELSSSVQYVHDFMYLLKDFTALSNKKGIYVKVFKVKEKYSERQILSFNGSSLLGLRISMDLKRKLRTRLNKSIPDWEELSLITIPLSSTIFGLPEIDGRTVIGYKLKEKGGVSVEIIIEKTGNL